MLRTNPLKDKGLVGTRCPTPSQGTPWSLQVVHACCEWVQQSKCLCLWAFCASQLEINRGAEWLLEVLSKQESSICRGLNGRFWFVFAKVGLWCLPALDIQTPCAENLLYMLFSQFFNYFLNQRSWNEFEKLTRSFWLKTTTKTTGFSPRLCLSQWVFWTSFFGEPLGWVEVRMWFREKSRRARSAREKPRLTITSVWPGIFVKIRFSQIWTSWNNCDHLKWLVINLSLLFNFYTFKMTPTLQHQVKTHVIRRRLIQIPRVGGSPKGPAAYCHWKRKRIAKRRPQTLNKFVVRILLLNMVFFCEGCLSCRSFRPSFPCGFEVICTFSIFFRSMLLVCLYRMDSIPKQEQQIILFRDCTARVLKQFADGISQKL